MFVCTEKENNKIKKLSIPKNRDSTTKQTTLKFISILKRFDSEWRALDYFISHQSKTTRIFIVNFSTILAFFVYAGKSRAEFIIMTQNYTKADLHILNKSTDSDMYTQYIWRQNLEFEIHEVLVLHLSSHVYISIIPLHVITQTLYLLWLTCHCLKLFKDFNM